MKVMRLDQKTLKMLGIIDSKGKPYYLRMSISRYVCLITPVLLLVPLIAYFFVHFHNVAQATSAFYLISIAGMAFATYSEFWLKRPNALSIIKRVQSIVDGSLDEFRPNYEKTESLVCNIVHYFSVFMFGSVFGVVSVPLCIFLFSWITGNDTTNLKVLPAALL